MPTAAVLKLLHSLFVFLGRRRYRSSLLIYLQKLLRGRVVQNMVCRVDPGPVLLL